jgi:Cysteine rich repeat
MVNMMSCAPICQADFSPRCRDNLAGQQPARLADWRLDHNLRTACKGDVPQLCSDALQAKEPQVQSARILHLCCSLWAWVGAICKWVWAAGWNGQGHTLFSTACKLRCYGCMLHSFCSRQPRMKLPCDCCTAHAPCRCCCLLGAIVLLLVAGPGAGVPGEGGGLEQQRVQPRDCACGAHWHAVLHAGGCHFLC